MIRSHALIKTYDKLVRFLDRLDPPEPGLIRVYRGQTNMFPKMLPTGLRDNSKMPGSLAWDSYTKHLAEFLLHQAPDQKRPDLLHLYLLWVHAMAQHYGPGTAYLDVSHSIEVALWFALHDHDWVETSPPGSPDSERDNLTIEQWLRFQQSGSGFLFVFDVPKWDGSIYTFPEHGQLVDLADAPEVFASSERLQMQNACLIAADAGKNGGDLAHFCNKCGPIPVGRPMSGSTFLNSSPDELFPGPDKDHWYRRFLSMPFIKRPDYKTRHVEMARPWPVTVYMPATAALFKNLAATSTRMSSLATDICSLTEMRLPPDASALMPWANFRMNAATPIILETPLFSNTPPVDSDQWNQGILAGDMSDSVDAMDLKTGMPSGPVDLRNVFLEFSLLETFGWEHVEDYNNRCDLLRAVWLMRNTDQFVLTLVSLSFPEQKQKLVGPYLYRFDPSESKFLYWSPARQVWVKLGEEENAKKILFVSLAVLRSVSPMRKPDPFPGWTVKTSEGRVIIVPVRDRAAIPVRIEGKRGGNDWYALKEAASDAPFFFNNASIVGELEFKGEIPWSQRDAQFVRSLLH